MGPGLFKALHRPENGLNDDSSKIEKKKLMAGWMR